MYHDNREGPSSYTYPERRVTACNGCKYLKKVAGMRGRFVHTNSFYCLHPEVEFREPASSILGEGRSIHFNIEGECETPSWCPFKNKKDGKE